MSDNIPWEIQADILNRLPIKSLIRSRSVSKPWKSFIDSSEFIAHFNLGHTEPEQLLVSYVNNNEKKFVSILDDNTFPQHKFPLTLPSSVNVNQLHNKFIIGCSQGLFCFYSHNQNYHDVTNRNVMITETAVIWNPTIRKSVVISLPNVLPPPYESVIGFGVCPRTNHPKLVKFVNKRKERFYPSHLEFIPSIIPPRVEICTSKSRVWSGISTNLPRESIALIAEHVAIDKFIYWLGYDRKYGGNYTICSNLILLFDITNEVFTEEVNLPDGLQGSCDLNMKISKLRDSLIVLDTDNYVRNEYQTYHVWMMENGFSKSFRKLYTIRAPDASIRNVFGFRKSGEPIIQIMPHSSEHNTLFLYDPDTKEVNNIGISCNGFSSFAISYAESLLLLDH